MSDRIPDHLIPALSFVEMQIYHLYQHEENIFNYHALEAYETALKKYKAEHDGKTFTMPAKQDDRVQAMVTIAVEVIEYFLGRSENPLISLSDDDFDDNELELNKVIDVTPDDDQDHDDFDDEGEDINFSLADAVETLRILHRSVRRWDKHGGRTSYFQLLEEHLPL